MQIGLIDTAIHLHHMPQANENVRVESASGYCATQSKTTNKPSHGNTSLQVLLKGLTTTQAEIPAIVCIDLQKEQDVILKVLQALDRLIENDVRIICLPLGINAISPIFNLAARACEQNNILIIAPSGNQGNGMVLTPAKCNEVLSVGAVDEYGQTPAFSGRTFDNNGICLKPDIEALGVRVGVYNNEEIIRKSGTSIACATVSGVAASMLQANPNATAYEIKMALIESCTPAYGSRYGIVNAEIAIKNIQSKALYTTSQSTITPPIPLERYIDPRLKSKCNQAKRNNQKVEALVAANSTQKVMQSFSSRYNKADMEYTLFTHFDMAFIRAKVELFDEFFEHPDINICSSTDVNYFDF